MDIVPVTLCGCVIWCLMSREVYRYCIEIPVCYCAQDVINPLMPELNRSEQRCLPEFFVGYFKF